LLRHRGLKWRKTRRTFWSRRCWSRASTRSSGYRETGSTGSSKPLGSSGKIRSIQVRHEEAAAFMACAWAIFTGLPRSRTWRSTTLHGGSAGPDPERGSAFGAQPAESRFALCVARRPARAKLDAAAKILYPKPGQARCVQIDLNPARIGLRSPVDIPPGKQWRHSGSAAASAESKRRPKLP
jgi:hypothetical protein